MTVLIYCLHQKISRSYFAVKSAKVAVLLK